MSAPRLILKQPTGWFAAGREFTQAITILSDGAFKLYVYACLRAGRHTGCLRATVDELARAMTRAPTAVAMNLDELEARAVCRVIRNGGSQLVLEIRDRFWPYQRQQPPGRTPGPETEFVQKVRSLFLAPACVQASFSAADEKLATGPVSTRRLHGTDHAGHPAGMRPQVCGHAQRQGPNADHQPAILLRHRRGSERIGDTGKLLGTASHEGDADGTTMAAGESSQTLMPQPVGQSPTAPHHKTTAHIAGMPAHTQRNRTEWELETQAGTLLDADAVRICVALFREKRLVMPGQIYR